MHGPRRRCRDAAAATRALRSAVRAESAEKRDRSWNEYVSNPGLSHEEHLERIRERQRAVP